MTHKFSSNYPLRIAAAFFAILTVLIAAAVAQTTGAVGPSVKAYTATAPPGGSGHAARASQHGLLSGTSDPKSVAVSRLPRKRSGVRETRQDDPMFLSAVTYYSGGDWAEAIAVADVNGDHKPDLLVANGCILGAGTCSGGVGVLLGNGDGTFQPAVIYLSGAVSARAIAVADLNGDGKPDLVVAHLCVGHDHCDTGNPGAVSVLPGNGDGTFQTAVAYNSGGSEAATVAVADLNSDGKLDCVIGNFYGGSNGDGLVSVLLGNGDGTLQPALTYSSGAAIATSVAVADVNGDGKPDLMVANECAGSNCPGSVGVMLGNGDGSFQATVTYYSGGWLAEGVAVKDVNSDHKPDVLVANNASGVGVLLSNGDGTFQPAVIYGSGSSGAVSVAVADVNGDGNADLLATNFSSNTVGVLLGNGEGVFQSAVVYDAGGIFPRSVAVGDVNGDGKPDLVVANESDKGTVGVLLNNIGPHSPTTTTLVSSPNPSAFGQGVTLTAMVSSSSGTPTGTVAFSEGSTVLGNATLANGAGSISVSSLATGSHSITVAYRGSLEFSVSTSDPLNQIVKPVMTTTSLTSSLNPAAVNQLVTYLAAVAGQNGGAATGTVVFQDGGTTIATVGLAGNRAAYATRYKMPGVHAITAIYSGDANNTGSMSAPLTEYIKVPSKTVLATSGSPSFVGQPVTLTARVTSQYGTIPDGELVMFYDGATAIGTGSTASGVANFTTSSLKAKTHTIKATCAGDTVFKPSTGIVTQVVNKYATTIALSSSPNPSSYGQLVTLTATVAGAGPSPTGKVWFKDGTTGIGTVTLNGGVATLIKSKLAVGTHPITAQYMGDAASAKSTSSVLNQVVQ